MQDEECLDSPKTKHVLNTMFILEYSLADLSFERNLEEQLKNEQKHRLATMKKLSKHSEYIKEGRKEKKLEKNKMNPCID